MMSLTKKIGAFLLVILVLALIVFLWYKYTYSMDRAAQYNVNSTSYASKLIIVTQGSEFKNAVTNKIVDFYKQDSIYIKVIDISALKDINPDDFNAVLLIHTWENWKPPTEIKTFIESTQAHKNKIVVFTTSGQSNYKMDGVDAITGESNMLDVDFICAEIIEKLNPLLKKTNKL